ncbi:MAG: DUF951 domain-containing protein [Lachnospiraceae bacterium]
MAKIIKISPGDILELKKLHPCGGKSFDTVRVGSDVRIICRKCGRDMTVPRIKLERSIKKITTPDGAVSGASNGEEH